MKPSILACRNWGVCGVFLALTSIAAAHPGHDHTDIPSVIRHPFAGPEHILIVGALLLGGVVLSAMVVRKALRAPSRHGARSRTG